MADEKVMGAGAKAALLSGGVALAGVLGWQWFGVEPESAPPQATVEQAAQPAPSAPEPVAAAPEPQVQPEAAPAPAIEPNATTDAEPVTEPAPAPPAFDTVRVEVDGSALIAGRALAGATVTVLLDGFKVATVPADASGSFAAITTLEPSDTPRMMTLMMELSDGVSVGSDDSVAIAPIAAREVPVADATGALPEPAPQPNPPATLLVTETGAQVLQGGQSDGQATGVALSIDAITYAPDGAVQLAGMGQAGAALRLYLDNAEALTLTVPTGGRWSATLPEVAPGLYTLRADQLDEAGKVTARFETPFKRETLEALAAAAGPQTEAPPKAVPEPASPPSAALPLATESPAPEAPATAEPEPTPQPAVEVATAPAEPAPPAAVVPQPVTVTVQPGFTLWQIARENFGQGMMYVQVFEANRDKIRDPDLIYPGQVFTVPPAQGQTP